MTVDVTRADTSATAAPDRDTRKKTVAPLYAPARIPDGSPAKVDPPEGEDLLTVNFGPNHPSTHGVLRLIVTLDGEVVVGLDADIGYLHTGIEKNMEQKSYWKAITYTPRIDYLSFFNNELCYVMAVERLIQLEVPERAQWIRTLFAELNRLHSHLVFLGTSGLELGAISIFFYTQRERDRVLDLFEMVTGVRMHDRYPQFGGVAEDLPRGFYRECRRFCDDMPAHIDEYVDLLAGNAIWRDRTIGIGAIAADTAIAMGLTGPNVRASGVPYDLRKAEPYLAYDKVDFDVVVGEKGDCYDRFLCRVKEMYESVRIIEQCLDGMPTGPYLADDRKYVLPPRHELHTSMESLIHHFKLVTEGFRVPPGQVYAPVESPRGELGCYLASDGGPRPWRVRFRAPSFVTLQVTAMMAVDRYIADLIAVVGSLDGVMGEVDR
jgi:NADH-quinone oxidoreductase subunit D